VKTAPRSRTNRLAGLAVAPLLALVLLGGCTSPRNALGTNSSPCFRALAVAKSAVHGVGHFDGVRYLSVSAFLGAIRHAEPASTMPAGLRGTKDPVCVVNYRGSFSSSRVAKGWPVGRSGHYAVVAVDAKTDDLLGTLVLRRSPVRFSRLIV
jgi:hypothetical protein